eukprot:jgi/Chrzof1/4246/Cz14g04200.t1
MYQHRLCQLTQTSSSNFAGVNSQGNQLFVKCLCKACLGKDAGPQCFILDDWVETHAKQAKLPDDDSAEVLVRQYIQASGEGFEAPMRPLGEYLKVRTEQLGGASLVGSSVWVDWGLHNQVDGKHWFQGHLRGYNKQTGEFKVYYPSDGDTSWLFLPCARIDWNTRPPGSKARPLTLPSTYKPALKQHEQQQPRATKAASDLDSDGNASFKTRTQSSEHHQPKQRKVEQHHSGQRDVQQHEVKQAKADQHKVKQHQMEQDMHKQHLPSKRGQQLQKAPAQQMPAKQMLENQTPAQQVPAQQMPAKQVPVKQVPAQQMPAKQMPQKQVPAHQLPEKQVPARQVPAKQVPAKQVPAKQVPAKQVPAPNIEPLHKPQAPELPKQQKLPLQAGTQPITQNKQPLLAGTMLSSQQLQAVKAVQTTQQHKQQQQQQGLISTHKQQEDRMPKLPSNGAVHLAASKGIDIKPKSVLQKDGSGELLLDRRDRLKRLKTTVANQDSKNTAKSAMSPSGKEVAVAPEAQPSRFAELAKQAQQEKRKTDEVLERRRQQADAQAAPAAAAAAAAAGQKTAAGQTAAAVAETAERNKQQPTTFGSTAALEHETQHKPPSPHGDSPLLHGYSPTADGYSPTADGYSPTKHPSMLHMWHKSDDHLHTAGRPSLLQQSAEQLPEPVAGCADGIVMSGETDNSALVGIQSSTLQPAVTNAARLLAIQSFTDPQHTPDISNNLWEQLVKLGSSTNTQQQPESVQADHPATAAHAAEGAATAALP